MPTAGNAAGNTKDLFDLTGANVSPAPLPAGFTPRGIVALTFSIVAGLLGVAVIAWYGVGELSGVEKQERLNHINNRAQLAGIASADSPNVDAVTVAPEK